jgi:hypothetical protein
MGTRRIDRLMNPLQLADADMRCASDVKRLMVPTGGLPLSQDINDITTFHVPPSPMGFQ